MRRREPQDLRRRGLPAAALASRETREAPVRGLQTARRRPKSLRAELLADLYCVRLCTELDFGALFDRAVTDEFRGAVRLLRLGPIVLLRRNLLRHGSSFGRLDCMDISVAVRLDRQKSA